MNCDDPSGLLVRVHVPRGLVGRIGNQKRGYAAAEEKSRLPIASEDSPYSIFAINGRQNCPNVSMFEIRGAHLRCISLLDRYAFVSEVVDVFKNFADPLVLGVRDEDRRNVGIVEELVFQHASHIVPPAHPVKGVRANCIKFILISGRIWADNEYCGVWR